MKKSTAVGAILALVILAILATSAAGYARLVRHLDEAKLQTQEADARAKELEQQAADLNADAAEARRIADERGREVSALRNQAAELEKQIADLKTRVNTNQNVTTFWADGVQPQPVILDLNGGDLGGLRNDQVQLQETVKRMQLDLNGVVGNPPTNVRLTEPAVIGVDVKVREVGGVITINGETLRVGGAPAEVKPAEPAPKDIKVLVDEIVDEIPPTPQVKTTIKRRLTVPPPIQAPKVEEKKADEF